MVMPPMETQVPVNAGQGDPTATAQIAITIVALRLPILGEYRFDLEVENTPLASIPLFVRKVDANPRDEHIATVPDRAGCQEAAGDSFSAISCFKRSEG